MDPYNLSERFKSVGINSTKKEDADPYNLQERFRSVGINTTKNSGQSGLQTGTQIESTAGSPSFRFANNVLEGAMPTAQRQNPAQLLRQMSRYGSTLGTTMGERLAMVPSTYAEAAKTAPSTVTVENNLDIKEGIAQQIRDLQKQLAEAEEARRKAPTIQHAEAADTKISSINNQINKAKQALLEEIQKEPAKTISVGSPLTEIGIKAMEGPELPQAVMPVTYEQAVKGGFQNRQDEEMTALDDMAYTTGKIVSGAAGAAESLVDMVGNLAYTTLGLATGMIEEGVGLLSGENINIRGKMSGVFEDAIKSVNETDVFGQDKLEQALEEKYGGRTTTINNLTGTLGEATGNILASILTGSGISKLAGVGANLLKSGGAGLKELINRLTFGATAAGSSTREAVDEGAGGSQATTYGMLSGALEVAIESLAGGIPGMGSGVIGKVLKKIPGKLTYFLNILGEGGEEALSQWLTPSLKRATYNPDAEDATAEEIAEAAAIGAILSAMMQGGAGIANIDLADLKGLGKQMWRRTHSTTDVQPTALENGNADMLQENESAQEASVTANERIETDLAEVSTPNTATVAAATETNQPGLSGSIRTPVSDLNITQGAESVNSGYAGSEGEAGDYTYIGRITGLPRNEAERARQIRAAQERTPLRRSGVLSGASEAQMDQAERLAAATGREVEFFRLRPTDRAVVNGRWQDGRIYINALGADPAAQIFSHELTHSLENTGSYGELQRLVMDQLRDVPATRKAIQRFYQENGVEILTDEQADFEITADYIAKNLLTDEQAITDMVRKNKALGQRIHNWIREMLARITGNTERAFLLRAERLYALCANARDKQEIVRTESPDFG